MQPPAEKKLEISLSEYIRRLEAERDWHVNYLAQCENEDEKRLEAIWIKDMNELIAAWRKFES